MFFNNQIFMSIWGHIEIDCPLHGIGGGGGGEQFIITYSDS